MAHLHCCLAATCFFVKGDKYCRWTFFGRATGLSATSCSGSNNCWLCARSRYAARGSLPTRSKATRMMAQITAHGLSIPMFYVTPIFVQNLLGKINMARSNAFAADLPALSEEQLEKLYVWGRGSCDKFDVHLHSDTTMTLTAVRKKDGTARDHQRLIRTNLINWGVALPHKQTGWLRLLPHDSISDAVPSRAGTAHVAPDPPQRNKAAPLVAHTPMEHESLLMLPANLLTTCGEHARSIAVPSHVCHAIHQC